MNEMLGTATKLDNVKLHVPEIASKTPLFYQNLFPRILERVKKKLDEKRRHFSVWCTVYINEFLFSYRLFGLRSVFSEHWFSAIIDTNHVFFHTSFWKTFNFSKTRRIWKKNWYDKITHPEFPQFEWFLNISSLFRKRVP